MNHKDLVWKAEEISQKIIEELEELYVIFCQSQESNSLTLNIINEDLNKKLESANQSYQRLNKKLEIVSKEVKKQNEKIEEMKRISINNEIFFQKIDEDVLNREEMILESMDEAMKINIFLNNIKRVNLLYRNILQMNAIHKNNHVIEIVQGINVFELDIEKIDCNSVDSLWEVY